MSKSNKLYLTGLTTGLTSLAYIVLASDGQTDLVGAVGTMTAIGLIFLAGQDRLPQGNENN